jgi:hypothetical protein
MWFQGQFGEPSINRQENKENVYIQSKYYLHEKHCHPIFTFICFWM